MPPRYLALRPAALVDVTSFLNRSLDGRRFDDAKFAELLWALIALDWSAVDGEFPAVDGAAIPFEFGVPRLLVEPRQISAERNEWVVAYGDEPNAKPDADVFDILATGQKGAVEECVNRAARRLKAGGRLVHGCRNRQQLGRRLSVPAAIDAGRLLAAMLFPLTNRSLSVIANSVLYFPEEE